ncbi:glycosyltransferase family 2 protein [Paracoccus sp. MC1854]|nr:glycosyltransferase family 2 protein [Paracoccus sp. MC1854]MBB1492645.1 glycosyltransferase family 2 protein [Paracoccus sp. MC1854]
MIIVGRDISYFLEHHIQHHLALGVSHVVYVDNGSTDNSIEIAKRFSNITIASCTADFRLHQGRIRYLANTYFLKGGWRLAIDPDELLDYPESDRIDLPELTRRMNARGHSAMVAQMLDMVFDGPASAAASIDFSQAERLFDRYSLAAIRKVPYHESGLPWAWFLEQNKTSNRDILIFFGGLRHAAFGEDCCLTKHALFRMGKGVIPHPHPHVTTGVICTDFSAALKHYKFAGDTLKREKKLLAENRIAHGETQLRVAKMEREVDINLGRYAECRGPAVERLIDQGFLRISNAAREMLS